MRVSRCWAGPSARADRPGHTWAMATYTLNRAAFDHARKLIENRQYVLNSDWGDRQPRADGETRFLATHSSDEYALLHLGLLEGTSDESKARPGCVIGD